MVKPTFVSELDQYVNIFSQFTYFCQKNNQDSRSFTKNNKRNLFYLKNNYTGEKQFLLSIRKLDSTPANFFIRQISIEFQIRAKKIQRKEKCMIRFQLKTPS